MARPARPMPAQRRAALIRAAADAFVEHGYQRASLNAILRTAGLSKSSAYHHVGDKQALFELAVGEYLDLLASHVELPEPQRLSSETWWAGVDGLLDQLGVAAQADPRTLVAGRLVHLTDAPDSRVLDGFRKQISAWGTAMLEQGRSNGAVDSTVPVELQSALVRAVAVEMDRWALQHSALEQPHRLIGAMLRRILRP